MAHSLKNAHTVRFFSRMLILYDKICARVRGDSGGWYDKDKKNRVIMEKK